MTSAELRARLAGGGGSHAPLAARAALVPEEVTDPPGAPLIPAAVLVPLLAGPAPGVLLTKRTLHLARHAGQVSFPGGRIDPGDTSPEHAALRETEEELGVARSHIQVLGRLPTHVTGSGFRITPVTALWPAGLAFTPAPAEVEAVFFLPMAVLLDPDAPFVRETELEGRRRRFWVWPHPQYEIWGATAAILVHLADRLRDPG